MALKRSPTVSTDAELDAALARGRSEASRGARSVRYDASTDRLEIAMNDAATVSIARRVIPGLEHATAKQLRAVRLTPLRTTIAFTDLDLDYAVNALVRRALGLNEQQRAAGAVTSPAKRTAAARNGARGGRPRKSQ